MTQGNLIAKSNGKKVEEVKPRQNGARRGHQNRYQGHRGGDKGKDIAREHQGDGRMEGVYHPYREKNGRGHNDVNAGNRRVGNQSRGHQFGGGDRVLENPEKLMLDAFKGVSGSPIVERPSADMRSGSGTSSKARKALLFEDKEPGGGSVRCVSDE
ncbi:unnamed protein product [Eruca vesicaria subsp. sativa]|uniref:Uncharacterized protein n=1 Tax=Eruca vesicaria subsp. sativa TaxID=29727 RepID=A0ABC8L5X8_ERUVS|nr:unnamed protein product [Eruca vesicaria subsp. sativa]